jgi:hypothetical protein
VDDLSHDETRECLRRLGVPGAERVGKKDVLQARLKQEIAAKAGAKEAKEAAKGGETRTAASTADLGDAPLMLLARPTLGGEGSMGGSMGGSHSSHGKAAVSRTPLTAATQGPAPKKARVGTPDPCFAPSASFAARHRLPSASGAGSSSDPQPRRPSRPGKEAGMAKAREQSEALAVPWEFD